MKRLMSLMTPDEVYAAPTVPSAEVESINTLASDLGKLLGWIIGLLFAIAIAVTFK
jgi:hypothetical protein